MSDAVDIIIPVYNTEEYIPRCIESVLNQKHTNWRLVLVDDGSTDSSGMICDEYASKDARITVIHKENAGVSIARNTGLAHSSNPYITFIDSDDYISPYYLINLLKPLQKNPEIDICISGCYVDYGDRIKNYGLKESIISINDYPFNVVSNNSYYALYVVWGTLFRRIIIEKYSLQFIECLNRDEDFIFKLSYLNKSHIIRLIGDIDYYHTDREDSLVKKNFDYTQINLCYNRLYNLHLEIPNKTSNYFNFVVKETLNRFEKLIRLISTSYRSKERIKYFQKLNFDFYKKYKHSDNWKNKFLDFLLTHRLFNIYNLLIDRIYKKNDKA